MSVIKKDATQKSPGVLLDAGNGLVQLSGRSLLEYAVSFFQELNDWANEYCKNPQAETRIELAFEYINSDSLKCLYSFLKIFDDQLPEGYSAIVKWSYEDGDDDMRKTGETYDSAINIHFDFVEVEEI